MGSASSRMSANPALILSSSGSEEITTSPPSTQSTSNPPLPPDEGLKPNGTGAADASTPQEAVHLTRYPKAPRQVVNFKAKGKQKAVEDKEEGEISDEDEADFRVRAGDSWRPPAPFGDTAPFTSLHKHPSHGNYAPRHAKHDEQMMKKGKRRNSARSGDSDPHFSHLNNQSSTSRSPLNRPIVLPTASHNDSSASKYSHAAPSHHSSSQRDGSRSSYSNSASPKSDSLALPKGVNSDEAAQYMDIIRNLMQDGISPETLIKRGATRRYVTVVCEELVQQNKRIGSLDAAEAGPSRPQNHVSPKQPAAIDMTRVDSDTSSDSLDVKDEVENILSPRQSHKLVPSSSWTPGRPAGSSSAALSRDPAPQVPAEGSSAATDKAAAPGPTMTLPKPVSSYVPTGPRALASLRAKVVQRRTPLASGSGQATPDENPAATLKVDLESSPSTVLAVETLAERKKRVLESMKRGRKVNMGSSATTSEAGTPLQPSGVTTPIAVEPPPAPIRTANLQAEVDALEREVMNLQDPQSTGAIEPEEGEIMSSNTPSPIKQDIPLPSRANLGTSAASANLANGVQLSRAKKRPHAEDMMENRNTSAKPSRPVKKRPFGRPLGWAKLQVPLDDSDDERSAIKPVRIESPSHDAERARIENEIALLKQQIEQRRLARLEKGKRDSASPVPAAITANAGTPGACTATTQADAAASKAVPTADVIMTESWRPAASVSSDHEVSTSAGPAEARVTPPPTTIDGIQAQSVSAC